MHIEKLKQILGEIAPTHRVRKLKNNSEYAECMNAFFPGVSPAVQVYSLFNNVSPYCVECNAPVKTPGKQTCSVTCRDAASKKNSTTRVEKAKATLIERYGVDNARLIPGTEAKRKDTLISKYGGLVSDKARESARSRAAQLNEKSRRTIKTKYGVDNVSQLPGHREKVIATTIKKHGVETYALSDEYRSIIRKRQSDKWAAALPNGVQLLGILAPPDAKQQFKDPNDLVYFECTECGKESAVPTETCKWRIANFGTPCVTCSGMSSGSAAQRGISEYVESLGFNVINNDRSVLAGLEVDIYIPELKMGIEYHGLYWHNDTRVDNNYHKRKLEAAEHAGIRLVQIFEDEWVHKRNIVESRLRNLLKKNRDVHYARKCKVVNVESKVATQFLEQYHIQGAVKSAVRLGLEANGELVALMTFGALSKAKGHTSAPGKWELLRFCTRGGMSIVGGASKMLKHFMRNYEVSELLSFADRRWSDGNLYKTLGFEFEHNTRPNYWYVDTCKVVRLHRYGLRKCSTDDQSKTEYENRLQQGYLRVWDCGSSKWILRGSKP